MTPDDPIDNIRQLWQDDRRETGPTPEEVRRLAHRLTSKVRWRNLREYAAGVLGTVWIVTMVASGRLSPVDTAGVVLLGLGGIYMATGLHRRGSAQVLPGDWGVHASLTFHRQQLIRQRDLLRWAARWYATALPVWPGALVLLVGSVLAARITWPWAAAHAVPAVALMVVVSSLNRRGAARVQREIDALDTHL